MERFSDEYLAFLAGTSGVHSMRLTGDDAKLSHAVDKPRILAAEVIALRARVAEHERVRRLAADAADQLRRAVLAHGAHVCPSMRASLGDVGEQAGRLASALRLMPLTDATESEER